MGFNLPWNFPKDAKVGAAAALTVLARSRSLRNSLRRRIEVGTEQWHPAPKTVSRSARSVGINNDNWIFGDGLLCFLFRAGCPSGTFYAQQAAAAIGDGGSLADMTPKATGRCCTKKGKREREGKPQVSPSAFQRRGTAATERLMHRAPCAWQIITKATGFASCGGRGPAPTGRCPP